MELINKDNVRATYKKARNEIVNKLLNNSITDDSLAVLKTSPEDTILNCVFVKTGLKPFNIDTIRLSNLSNAIDVIRNFLLRDHGSFKDLYTVLRNPPFGMRKGALPLLIANEIAQLDTEVIIYYKNFEVTLNSETLERINENPKDYTFKADFNDVDKNLYLNSLSHVFNTDIRNGNVYSNLTLVIQKWYQSLPKYTKQCIGKDETISSLKIRKIKKKLSNSDLNPSDFILEDLPKIFSGISETTVSQFKNIKCILDNYITNVAERLKRKINEKIKFDPNTSLQRSMRLWILDNKNILDSKILDQSSKQIIEFFNKELEIESEYEIINTLVYKMTGLFIEDWSLNTENLFNEQLQKLVGYTIVKETSDENQITIKLGDKEVVKLFNNELDDSTILIENIIQDTFDDFGDSISNEQKIALLVKIMKNYL